MRRSLQGYLVLLLAVGPLLLHPWIHPTGDFAHPDPLTPHAHDTCGHSHDSCPTSHGHDPSHDDEGDSEQDCDHYCSLCAARCEPIPLDFTTRFLAGWLDSLSEDLFTVHQEPLLQWLDWPQPLSRRGPPGRLS